MEHDQQDNGLGAPHRPGDDWRCRDDGEEWPCPVFRRRMWSLYRNDRDRLVVFMRHFRDRAAPAIGLTAEQAEARFVGWAHEPPAPVRKHRRRI
ncbi:hypothetical protein [Micromonospora sp. NBC_01796]|uniref:hypothetical protein n=1 Tax=Micromonospora sp. NBC_01796 TaxID=2975987 RepID=UPI002DDBEC0F|nr:hypothetical protein [Micromonospora sp. NBC_01796]WSA88806.1 hypothetical protein OIE47_15015 [Micromonospora sp. NBC_01796]